MPRNRALSLCCPYFAPVLPQKSGACPGRSVVQGILQHPSRAVFMPRLIKGAKWTHGWVVIGPGGEVPTPPEEWRAYGFEAGGVAVFTAGSATFGGFCISTPTLMAEARRTMGGAKMGELGRSQFAEGWTTLPPEVRMDPGVRLLAVRGSGRALGSVAQGRIYEEAVKHPELKVFEIERGLGSGDEAPREM